MEQAAEIKGFLSGIERHFAEIKGPGKDSNLLDEFLCWLIWNDLQMLGTFMHGKKRLKKYTSK